MASLDHEPRLSIAEELVNMINKIEYKSDIGYIPDTNGVDINVFNQGNLSEMYYLDTVHCVTKRKTYNR